MHLTLAPLPSPAFQLPDSFSQQNDELGKPQYIALQEHLGSKPAIGAPADVQQANRSSDVAEGLEQTENNRDTLQEAYNNLEGRLHQAVRARDYAREQAEHAEQQLLTLKQQVDELLQLRIRLETKLLSREAGSESGTASQTRLLEEVERWQLKAHKAEKALDYERASSCALRRQLESQRSAAEHGSRAAEVTAALQHQVAEARALAEERRREVDQLRRALAISDETVGRLKQQLQSLLHVVHQGQGAFISPRVSMTAGSNFVTSPRSPAEQQLQPYTHQQQHLQPPQLSGQLHSMTYNGSTQWHSSNGNSAGMPGAPEHNHDQNNAEQHTTAAKPIAVEQQSPATPTVEQEQLVKDLQQQCSAATRAVEQLMTENANLVRRINEQANAIRRLQEVNRRGGDVPAQSSRQPLNHVNGGLPTNINGILSHQGSMYAIGNAPSIHQPFQRELLPGGLSELQWKLVMVTEEVHRLESEVSAARAAEHGAGQFVRTEAAAGGQQAPAENAVLVNMPLELSGTQAEAPLQGAQAGSTLQQLHPSVEGLDLPPEQLQARILEMAARMTALVEELEALQVVAKPMDANPRQQLGENHPTAITGQQQQEHQPLPGDGHCLQEVVVEQQPVSIELDTLQPAADSAPFGSYQPVIAAEPPPPSQAISELQPPMLPSQPTQPAVPVAGGETLDVGLHQGSQVVQGAMTVQLPLATTFLSSTAGAALDMSKGHTAVQTHLSAPLVVKGDTLELQAGHAIVSKAGRSGLWGWLAGEERGIDI